MSRSLGQRQQVVFPRLRIEERAHTKALLVFRLSMQHLFVKMLIGAYLKDSVNFLVLIFLNYCILIPSNWSNINFAVGKPHNVDHYMCPKSHLLYKLQMEWLSLSSKREKKTDCQILHDLYTWSHLTLDIGYQTVMNEWHQSIFRYKWVFYSNVKLCPTNIRLKMQYMHVHQR